MYIPVISLTNEQQSISAPTNELKALYKVSFFGPFRVIRSSQCEEEFTWRRNKAKALLKWFLLNPAKMFSTNQLAALFWPDIPQSLGIRNLHVTINYLRHLLEPDLGSRQESKFVRRNKHNLYWFDLNSSWEVDIFDIHNYIAAAKSARQRGDIQGAIMYHRKIADYCSQGFLPEDTYEETFIPYRRHYELVYTHVLERLIRLCLQARMYDEVISYSLQILQEDPYSELAIRAIAISHFQQENVARAIRTLDEFQQLLKSDLSIKPSNALLSLRNKILK